MLHRAFAFVPLIPFILNIPAMAHIVDVSFGSVVSGSGSITACCIETSGCASGADIETFNLLGGGSADGGRVTMTAVFSDSTTVTPTSLNAEIVNGANVQALGAEWGASALVAILYGIDFTLTTESILHLEVDQNQNFGVLHSGGTLLSLEGPGFLYSSPLSTNVDQLFTLMPGTYMLNVDNFGTQFGFFPRDVFTDETFTNDLFLSADFTPAVPEPRWTLIPLLLLAMLPWASRRRHSVS